jgi:hypothetical protein
MFKIKIEMNFHIKEPQCKLQYVKPHNISLFHGLFNIYYSKMLMLDPTYKIEDNDDFTLSKLCKFHHLVNFLEIDYKKMI